MSTKPVIAWSCLLASVALLCGVQPAPCAPAVQDLRVEIVEPAGGSTLQGTVVVRVRTTPAEVVPRTVLVGLGARPWGSRLARYGQGPWFPVKRVRETNDWTAIVDTTMVPNGATALTAFARRPDDWELTSASADVVIGNELHCYFGDLHSHTAYSDGTAFPKDA